MLTESFINTFCYQQSRAQMLFGVEWNNNILDAPVSDCDTGSLIKFNLRSIKTQFRLLLRSIYVIGNGEKIEYSSSKRSMSSSARFRLLTFDCISLWRLEPGIFNVNLRMIH